MKTKLYSIYDSKALAFLPPICAATDGVAVRMFQSAVLKEGHDFNQYPEDYSLHQVGTWEDETGELDQAEPNKAITTAMALKSASHIQGD